MYHLLILLVLVILAIDASPTRHTRIKRMVGGNEASPGQFPYQVSIRLENKRHNCGGSILNERFILTAAHCVKDEDLETMFIVAGTYKLSDIDIGDIYHIENATYHKNYNERLVYNDIALIKVKQDIKFNDYVKPIPLETGHIPLHANLTVSGWGLLKDYDSTYPDVLQFEVLTRLPPKKCKLFYNLFGMRVNNKQICTFSRYGQGVCYGDSGSPLVYDGKLVGVVSWSGDPCEKWTPDVYTMVKRYLDWIKQTTAKLNDIPYTD